ncbi:hypothetical protein HOC35_05065 [Candidatus Woesearchaeota archaeon]|jgi:hypothetical protein|nr:hypothetical protein [Candidatus Woesearchaeota archaeon]
MGIENIKVGDTNIRVGFRFGDLGFTKLFPKADTNTIDAVLDVNVGFYLDGSPIPPDFNGYRMEILVGDDFGINIYNVMRYIGYLAGNVSEKYRFCHGAGLVLDGKGIMLTGKSGRGKSTLSSSLEGDVLDDDMLLVSPTEIRRLGNIGARRNQETRRIEWLENDNYKAPLHYVFVLNNQYDPDHVVQLQPEDIKPKITFDDKLHACLLAKYKSRMPIQFEVPIYEIGTKREPAETKKVIEAIISK